jgi:DNA mismatch endonuclease Vsr
MHAKKLNKNSRKIVKDRGLLRSPRLIVVEPSGHEQRVRREAHRLGLRFRLRDHEMPGTPHLVFPKYRAVLFVCRCHTYGHDCPEGTGRPWYYIWEVSVRHARKKLDAVLFILRRRGWKASVLWDCEIAIYRRLEDGGTQVRPDLPDRIVNLVCSSEPPSPAVEALGG